MTAFTINWVKADWSLQDVEIARELGCSRERVRQARLDPEIGKGVQPLRFRKRTTITAESRLSLMDTTGMTLDKVADLAGCKEQRAALILRKLGKGYRRRPRGAATCDWSKFPGDWLLRTDKEIAVLVGASVPAVVAQWRNRHGYRKNVR